MSSHFLDLVHVLQLTVVGSI